jgi:hypothetical protein
MVGKVVDCSGNFPIYPAIFIRGEKLKDFAPYFVRDAPVFVQRNVYKIGKIIG